MARIPEMAEIPEMTKTTEMTETTELSWIQLLDRDDNFPCPVRDPERYVAADRLYYPLRIVGLDVTIGRVHPAVAAALVASPGFSITDGTAGRRSIWMTDSTAEARSLRCAHAFALLRNTKAESEGDIFSRLARWHGELVSAHDPGGTVLFRVERAAAALLGIAVYGDQLIVHTPDDKVWVATRASDSRSYPGMLDAAVAGAVPADECPDETVVREAWEEASLPEELVRERMRACGAVSSFLIMSPHHLQPFVDGVYEFCISEDSVPSEPSANDGSVERFDALGLDELAASLKAGRFKPGTSKVLIDFLVRRGVISEHSEGPAGYAAVVAQLRRPLDYPLQRWAEERLAQGRELCAEAGRRGT